MRRLPPLSTLQAFEAVARLGSVTRAAEELGRTHGAVSKHLRTLQEHAGLALFDKVGTGLAPNAGGRRLAEAVGKALDEMAIAYEETTRQTGPVLKVACSATFAMRWLVPHLAEFSKARPDVSLRLSMTSAREMREDREADLVILWDRSAYPQEDQVRAVVLAEARFAPVAAATYPARIAAGRLETSCLIIHDHTTRAWDLWSRSSGVRAVASRSISFPHTHLCIEAALGGLGVAMVEQRLVAQELAGGRLRVVGPRQSLAGGFAAIPNARRPMSAEAKAFLEWLAGALSG